MPTREQRRELYAQLRAKGYTGRHARLLVHRWENAMKKPDPQEGLKQGRITRYTEIKRQTEAEGVADLADATEYRKLDQGAILTT